MTIILLAVLYTAGKIPVACRNMILTEEERVEKGRMERKKKKGKEDEEDGGGYTYCRRMKGDGEERN